MAFATEFEQAAERGVGWLARTLRADGSFGDRAGLTAHYKSPLAFGLLGRHREGERVLGLIGSRFQATSGHLVDTSPGSRRRCDLYEDLWVTWGAKILGEHDVALRVFSYVSGFFDHRNGGLSSTVSDLESERVFDLRSTALGGLVAIEMGAFHLARAAADFTAHLLLDQQACRDAVFLVRDRRGHIIREFGKGDERFFVVRRGLARPMYYALGLGVCLLSRYAIISGESCYLVAARRYVGASLRFAPEILRHDYSGKLCWGLHLMAEATQEPRFADLEAVVARFLCHRQSPAGNWTIDGVDGGEADRSIDMTAERSVWLKLISQAAA